jgi:hypothetical protein
MDEIERKAFLYAKYELDGAKVDWVTGKISWPKE